jgi:hypothetical protein
MKPLGFLVMKNGIIKRTQPAPGIQPSGVVVFLADTTHPSSVIERAPRIQVDHFWDCSPWYPLDTLPSPQHYMDPKAH